MKLTPTIKAIGKDIKEILGHIANLRSDVADLKSKGGGEARCRGYFKLCNAKGH